MEPKKPTQRHGGRFPVFFSWQVHLFSCRWLPSLLFLARKFICSFLFCFVGSLSSHYAFSFLAVVGDFSHSAPIQLFIELLTVGLTSYHLAIGFIFHFNRWGDLMSMLFRIMSVYLSSVWSWNIKSDQHVVSFLLTQLVDS